MSAVSASTIEVYLVRHGVAGERGPAFPDDRLRPLTEEGITRFRQAVRGLAAMAVGIDVVLTSPLVRARQTAELLVAGLPGHPRLDTLDALAPGGRVPIILEAIFQRSRQKQTRIALVGHEPDLGELASRLLGARGGLQFKKGAVCCIELQGRLAAGPGTLLWHCPPRLLRRLAR
jgi:phosphohistidine phosphatase